MDKNTIKFEESDANHLAAAEEQITTARQTVEAAKKKLVDVERSPRGASVQPAPATNANTASAAPAASPAPSGKPLFSDTFAAAQPALWELLDGEWTYTDGTLRQSQVKPSRSAARSGKQPGDPHKAALAMIKVVQADKPPLRLPLGELALGRIRNKIKLTQAELDAWVRTMDSVGLVKANILTYATGAEFDAAVRKFSRHKDRFHVWCGFDYTGYDRPGWTSRAIAELERCHQIGRASCRERV